jgi:hypothetical protein
MLVYYFTGKVKSLPYQWGTIRCYALIGSGLTREYCIRLKKFAGTNTPAYFATSFSDEEKSFNNTDTRNLRPMRRMAFM